MYKKIILSALLYCLFFSNGYSQYNSMKNCIMGNSSSLCIYVNIFYTVDAYSNATNPQKNYNVFYVQAIRRSSTSQEYTYSRASMLVSELNGVFTRVSTFPYIDPSDGSAKTGTPVSIFGGPALSQRSYYTYLDILSYHTLFNDLIPTLPVGISGYRPWAASSLVPLDLSVLTQDTDGGGASDYEEIYREPYPGTDINDPSDDVVISLPPTDLLNFARVENYLAVALFFLCALVGNSFWHSFISSFERGN